MELYNCPKCDGTGAITHGKLEYADYVCPHCLGEKKLDWVEVVMGKKSITMQQMYNYYKEKWMEPEYITKEFPFKGEFTDDKLMLRYTTKNPTMIKL